MRVILRFSLNRDTGSALRNALKDILEQHDIWWTGRMTATYEGNVPIGTVRNAMRAFWNCAAHHPGPGEVDHFWMYSDRKAPPPEEIGEL